MRNRNIKDPAADNEGDDGSDIFLPDEEDGHEEDLGWLFVGGNILEQIPSVSDICHETASTEQQLVPETSDDADNFTDKLVSNMLQFCLNESDKEDKAEEQDVEKGDDGKETSEEQLQMEAGARDEPKDNNSESNLFNFGQESSSADMVEAEVAPITGPEPADNKIWIGSSFLNRLGFRTQDLGYSAFRSEQPAASKNSLLHLGKLTSPDGEQYIKRRAVYDPENGILMYAGRFRSGDTTLKLHSEGSLLTSGNSYVARVEIGPVKDLDHATNFREAKTLLMKHMKIVKVLLDDELQESKKAKTDFEACLDEICTESSTNLQNTEDLLQLWGIVQKHRSNSHKMLEAIQRNQYVSLRVKSIISRYVEKEMKMTVRNYVFSAFGNFFGRSQMNNWMENLKMCIWQGLRNHHKKLVDKCPAIMKKHLARLPDKYLLFVTTQDLKLFSDIISALNKAVFEPILPILVSRYFKRISKIKEDHLWRVVPVTNHVYFFLCKSLLEVAEELKSKADVEKVLEYKDDEWKIVNLSEWTPATTLDSCLKHQLQLLIAMVNHYEPGKYVPNKCFEFELKAFVGIDESIIEQTHNAFKSDWGKADTVEGRMYLPDELHVWLCLLDDTISHVFSKNPQNISMFSCLLKLYTSFCLSGTFQKDSLESLRVITHNTIRFISQAGPFICAQNKVDSEILLKQIDLMNTVSFGNQIAFNEFRDLVEVFTTYWKQRNEVMASITAKLPGEYLQKDANLVQTLILQCMSEALNKKVGLNDLISFCRVYDEFLIDLNDVEFDWYVRLPQNEQIEIFVLSKVLTPVNNKWKDSTKKCYKVTNLKKFSQLYLVLCEDDDIPEHYLVKIMKTLLGYIIDLASKTSWSQEEKLTEDDQIAAMSLMITSVRSSLLYLKEQPEYICFDRFMEESTKPFSTVINNSVSFEDYKKRVLLIKESFWYVRNMNAIDINAALKLCKRSGNNEFDEDLLKSSFEKYSTQFEMHMAENAKLETEDRIKKIVAAVKGNVESNMTSEWTEEFKQEKLPLILAGLGAVWALTTSQDVASTGQYLKPHCIQILCVFRLLGTDNDDDGVEKHLAQVLTGQGKSLILGLTAAVLALFGHTVHIMCYSEYLAERDSSDFDEFYDYFSIIGNIRYKTFEEVATKLLSVNIWNAESYIMQCLGLPQPKKGPKVVDLANYEKAVLLIDEVDVFFSDHFYGKSYSQCICARVPGLNMVQLKIWELVTQGNWSPGFIKRKVKEYESYSDHRDMQRLRDFMNEPESYELLIADGTEVVERTYTNKSLYLQHLDRMISIALYVYKADLEDDYLNRFRLSANGNISYRTDLGKYSEHTFSSYYNTFIYMRMKNGVNMKPSNYGYMIIDSGSISYAKLPENYPLILGVTGTLTTLNEHEKRAVKNHYQITQSSIMPSFFGDCNLKFDKIRNFDCTQTQTLWMMTIFSRINDMMRNKRAVLVFFDDDISLNAFKKEYSSQLDRLNVLTVNTDDTNMESYINDAGVAKAVTLATREMGRGIDYKTSVSVEKNGGIHVIQTFFSLDVKEETQIKGRTARKDNRGSYELVVCVEHLVDLELVAEGTSFFVVTYDMLAGSRKNLIYKNGVSKDTKVEEAEKRHNKTIEFYNDQYD